MKRPKDRLHRVIIIGATPAGVAAANKLGELGIPVTLIDREPDLDKKLSREEWRLASGVSFNFAHRSGLFRMLRNQAIKRLLPAEVTSLKHTPQGFRVRVRTTPTFVFSDRCILCGRCDEICPVTMPDGKRPISFNGRMSLPGRPVLEKKRQALCQTNCPLGVNVQGYIALARVGKYEEALDLVRQNNILPGICGRVCTHPCEEACRRGELDNPIAIKDIKRFLADYELSHHPASSPKAPFERPEKVAVIGSGPAGLAAAADLRRAGYQVDVFEKEAEAGGLLRYGIGPYRLPREILDYEVEYIKKLGVRFNTSSPIDLSEDIERLRQDFNAVILTVGTWSDRMLGVQGEELDGVEGCLSFLNSLYQGQIEELKEKVAVIGDGNSAFDLARVLRRLGAGVTILSWFPEDLIPADPEDVKGACEEGILLMDRMQVVSFSNENGRLSGLTCKLTEPGEPDDQGIPWPVIIHGSESFEYKFDRAIVAIGQKGPFQGATAPPGLKVTTDGLVEVDESFQTSIGNLYAAGDAVTGPSSIVEAMSMGRAVAASVHKCFSLGEDKTTPETWRPEDEDFAEIPAHIPSLSRPTMPERQPAARCENFSEVALGLNRSQVLSEAERCLQCGLCSECLLCADVCTLKAINHGEQPEEIIEHGGAVIIADPQAGPAVKGEDVIRAYGPKAAKPDVYAMITRGFAAAAKAMVLLGGTTHRPKGHGVSFSPPGPEMSQNIRVGVFVCRCNDSLGWHEEMNNFVARLAEQEDIVHAEIMPSACVPEGFGSMLKAIREKGITRVALASCVCCPLDFMCSACTDQRSRLKDALFSGTGVSRSIVETCNLRGEAIRLLVDDKAAALSRFTGLLDRSIHRARRLRALPTPARTYNFTTAVIGESEAAICSAHTLAEAGLDVLMFRTSNKPLGKNLTHPNIHCFENSTVKGMSGTLGDFQIFLGSEDFYQVIQVGAVIIGEKYRRLIPYIPLKGLPRSTVKSSMQKRGIEGIPFLYPGSTSIAGLFLANPTGIHVSEIKKGAAAAVLAAAIMPRGPRQNKGYTVEVDKDRCRGCGRCLEACPYKAVTFHENEVGGWHAVVDEALCKGCGNCISICPSNAADSPFRNQAYLEEMLEEVLVH